MPGDDVRVFDGRGREWDARVESVGREAVWIALDAEIASAAEPPARLTLALAMLKSEYMDAAVRDAAMVGVASLQPLLTVRTAVRADDAAGRRLVARWERIARAAVKQCGRAVVPDVQPPARLAPWLTGQRETPSLKLVLVEPSRASGAPAEPRAWLARAQAHGGLVLVGPEGGWTDDELEQARAAGFLPWTISRRILRADAVPVAALSVLFYVWEYDGPTG
jgi:16S rRNA (uracil1498-N3)-methyltransferase